ncbi:hypothetical protein [Actinomycetospora aeridis]|uniref:Uncharacterized protein n=1 Tax=Actinomycetospora aeridis TaxID=3129231 RepID=A0ABU8N9X5_9PSEU
MGGMVLPEGVGMSQDQYSGAAPKPRVGRAWAQQVEVSVAALRAQMCVTVAERTTAEGIPREVAVVRDNVERLLVRAEEAARGQDPKRVWLVSWWRGTDIEAAFGHLHKAQVEAIRLYDEADIAAEIPAALARVEIALERDDPVRIAAGRLAEVDHAAPATPATRALLRTVVADGFEAADRQLTRVRNLRNVLLIATVLITVLDLLFGWIAFETPAILPLCFEPSASSTVAVEVACPTGDGFGRVPDRLDMVVVALLGLLGGSLAAAVSIRNMRATATPYDIPVCLALLKVPTGALTAVGALIAIRGQFIPGLSALDSQEQILAYALVFGYAQQLLTGLIDRRARTILDNLAGPKDPEQAHPVHGVPGR